MNDALEALEAMVAAASRAPSGDNLQPWRFELDPHSDRVTILLDPARDPSPMNAGQRMSRIACGAALENMLRTARRNGWVPSVLPEADRVGFTVELGNLRCGSLDDVTIKTRVTNRRMYDRRPVPAGTVDRLETATPELEGVETCWLTRREDIDTFARMEACAFEHMYGASEMRRAIIGNVRFDLPAGAPVDEGLSPESLELNGIQKQLLKGMGGAPDWLLRCGALKPMAAFMRKLARSSSGLCVIMAPDASEETDYLVGRALQRAWLQLTEEGLAAQPMMSLAVLENVLANGPSALQNRLRVEEIEALLSQWPTVLPQAERLWPAFVLRFGYAPAPSGRTSRRPAAAVTRVLAGEAVQTG